MRQVPRNIDRPNRNAEFAFMGMATWYGTMFATGKPLLAFVLTLLGFYLTYKLTLNKPEGNAYRLWYRNIGLGKMIKPPKKVRMFEV
ncbi:MAG: hypothetical protein GC134_09995 [Proteobacteria bacterium]|nr:hypothetical protein [Pseudomonadota bacterium]